jgi:hypothetical protein
MIGRHRRLVKASKPFQQEYLTALGGTVYAYSIPQTQENEQSSFIKGAEYAI